MGLWLFTMFLWASPPDSVVRLKNLNSTSELDSKRGLFPQPRKINPLRQHAIADFLLAKPSFLAMINRYVSGEDIAKDVASQKKDIYVLGNKSSRWYWLMEGESTQFIMLVLSKKEVYPVKDPFSKSRNKVLFDSIRFLQEGCSRFTSEVDGTLRRWVGQNCSIGNIWIEWEATREFPMYILVQRK